MESLVTATPQVKEQPEFSSWQMSVEEFENNGCLINYN